MKVQAFIFNWPGRKQHAAKLEAMVRPHCAVAVINSDDSLRAPNKTSNPAASFRYCSFAYSALASFRMGMSGSASFHSAKNSW
jgi:hypothetical protein